MARAHVSLDGSKLMSQHEGPYHRPCWVTTVVGTSPNSTGSLAARRRASGSQRPVAATIFERFGVGKRRDIVTVALGRPLAGPGFSYRRVPARLRRVRLRAPRRFRGHGPALPRVGALHRRDGPPTPPRPRQLEQRALFPARRGRAVLREPPRGSPEDRGDAGAALRVHAPARGRGHRLGDAHRHLRRGVAREDLRLGALRADGRLRLLRVAQLRGDAVRAPLEPHARVRRADGRARPRARGSPHRAREARAPPRAAPRVQLLDHDGLGRQAREPVPAPRAGRPLEPRLALRLRRLARVARLPHGPEGLAAVFRGVARSVPPVRARRGAGRVAHRRGPRRRGRAPPLRPARRLRVAPDRRLRGHLRPHGRRPAPASRPFFSEDEKKNAAS